jgi:predicted permease
LIAAVVLVLTIACTNLANLALARNSRRTAELGIRLALGASRRRLIRELSSEGIILAAAGLLLGLGVARALLVVFSTELSLAVVTLQVVPRIDGTAFAASIAAMLVALLVVGILPAWRASRTDVTSVLANGTTAIAPRWRGRGLIISLQVAASVLLVSIAAIYIGEIRRQSQPTTGVDLERLALVHVDFARQRYDELRAREVADRVSRQLAARGDVESVAVSSGFPLGLLGTRGGGLRAEDGGASFAAQIVAGTSDLLRTLGIRTLRGRPPGSGDKNGGEPVAALSESLARQMYGGGTEAIGRKVVLTHQPYFGESRRADQIFTVVGIAADTRPRVGDQPALGVVYLSLEQQRATDLVISVRARTDARPLVGALRQAVSSTDADVAVGELGTGVEIAGADTLFPRIVAGIATVLGGVALLLALSGLYGVLSQLVAGRTREIGVRLALGAGAGRIERMVLRQGLIPVLFGLIGGMVFGVGARSVIPPPLLRMVPVTDYALMAIVPLAFIATGFAACYLPARRASRVNPNVALRAL